MATKNNAQKSPPGPVAQQLTKLQSNSHQAITPQLNGQQPPAKKDKWGFSDKTFWEWIILIGALLAALGAIAVPFVVTIIGLNYTQQQTELSIAASKQRHQTDLQISQDQQHEALLEGYLDHMSDLLLNGHLRDSKPGDEIRTVARARTLETLFRLDPGRREGVLGFLFEAGLIGVSVGRDKGGQQIFNPIPTMVYLNGADLTKATLDGHILVKADLSYTYLSDSDMSRAVLYTTNLHGAILENTNLTGAILIDADLSDTSLEGAMMNYQTILSETNLQGAEYNTKPIQVKNAQGNPLTLEPTQWPQGFDPKAAGAICIDF